MFRVKLTLSLTFIAFMLISTGLGVGGGCSPAGLPFFPGSSYNNSTDRTNRGASYIGASACNACHSDIGAKMAIHGHAHQLTRVQGSAPVFPSEAVGAGVTSPPQGFTWSDISYLVGGYYRKAAFVDQDGYLLVTGVTGVNTQYDLAFAPTGTTAGFVPYEPTLTTRKPYDYSCFVCHTTGPNPQDPASPQFQDNRPGITGTWQEPGVRCEGCHGPGSNHPSNPFARDLFVDARATFCGDCHSRTYASGGGQITAKDGFIENRQQFSELLASGGHASMACVDCHDPHVSTTYDASKGIRRTCVSCHWDKDMGFHRGVQYVRGDYVEDMSCTSCHMPFATKTANSVVLGESVGRVGDIRTHIFRISTDPVGYTAMFSADGSSVVQDSNGKSAITVDFVCLRCHNSDGGYPFKLTIRSASEIALGIHGFN